MNENVIKFQKPKAPKSPKKPRQITPGLRKLLIVLAVVVFFAGAWAYFTLTA
jgi:hypothetical protein